jgi:uncharacterized protein (DUF697 family)
MGNDDATNTGPSGADIKRRLDQSTNAVQRNVYWAMGAGMLPLPLFDLLAITGVQIKMLREISLLYDVSFSENMARKAVMSLLAGVGGVGLGGMIGASLTKLVPFIGVPLGIASVPIVSGMLTHAVGRIFVMHFEAGGSLLDFDPKAMRGYFEKEYAQSKIIVTRLHKQGEPGSPVPGSKPI